jgi:hypothetical protein
VIMPDHVHLIFTAVDSENHKLYSLAEIMGGIKGASAQLINGGLGRRGRVWQTESVDRVLRSFRIPRCEAGLRPRQSRSGWFGFPMRGATCGHGSVCSIPMPWPSRLAALSAGQPRRRSLRERYTRSSSFSCCAAPPFHDASNCFRINPAS